MPFNVLARLKQRNVLRVGGVYAVTGYALFQIADDLFPALNLPKWTVTLAAALFLLGFPIALVIAYAFERTPEGIRRASPDTADVVPPRLGWFDWVLLGATVVLVSLGVSEFLTRPAPVPVAVPAASSGAAALRAAAGVPSKSVAVLPFVNFSRDADADDFADGLTEELINGLAQLPDLHVAGRTSSFYFKGRNEDLREIGRKLGVAHVVEGSVRRSGDRLRITAQLIKVADGFHLWSETYDRTLDDAFAIQTQIATTVARVLETRLLREPPDAAVAARDPRAYRLALIARSHLRKQELADLRRARTLYAELMRLEPGNAEGYVGYAEATINLAQNHLALDFDQARRESEAAIEQALGIAPRAASAWRVKGLISRILAIRSEPRGHADDALAAFRHAVELDPQDADALAMLAAQLVSNGQLREAEPLLARALQLDPLSRLVQHLLGTTLSGQGRFPEAERQFASLIALYPDYTNARVSQGHLLMQTGRLDEAVLALDDEALIRADPLAGLMLANCYANLGMDDEMSATLQRIRDPAPAAAVARAALLQRRGQTAELERFAEQQAAATRDPIWRAVRLLAAAMTRDTATARSRVAELPPGLLRQPPEVEDHTPIDALLAAELLRRSGHTEQATRIAESLLRLHAPAPGAYQPVESLRIRALAFAVQGQNARAIAELEQARRAGWRTLIDFDYFTRIDDYPMMAALAGEPGFRALLRDIKADNARLRGRLAAARQSGARS